MREATIAQIATAVGSGGVGIVRISGPRAHQIGRALVKMDAAPEARRVYLRHAYDRDESMLDRGLYLEFAERESFTGEPTAEFQGHGGVIGLKRILARCLDLGARAAEAGEFTRRAFENGKIDLAEAEGIAQAVAAESELAHRVSQRQLRGELSQRIKAIRAPLVDAATSLATEIEFPEDGLGAFDHAHIAEQLDAAKTAIDALLESHRAGKLLRGGAVVVMMGPPNTGKSSVLNAFVGYDRAIVSPLAGTTRDTIEERTTVGGVSVRLIDTAGLHVGADLLEEAGIARARVAAAQADIRVVVLSDDVAWQDFVVAEEAALEAAVWVVNKTDQGPIGEALTAFARARDAVFVSARTRSGLESLEQKLAARLSLSGSDAPIITLERHARLLGEAGDALRHARATMAAALPADMVLVDLNIAVHRLGEVLGENVSEEVLNEIFKRFCIGK